MAASRGGGGGLRGPGFAARARGFVLSITGVSRLRWSFLLMFLAFGQYLRSTEEKMIDLSLRSPVMPPPVQDPSGKAAISRQDLQANPVPMDHHDVESAKCVRVLKYPFEIVHELWEGGPRDPNVLREDVKTTRSPLGAEFKKKTIYTKNALPYILRKTLISDEEFRFEEEQEVDFRRRFTRSSSSNKSLQGLVKAERRCTLKADPKNSEWSILEQSMEIEFSDSFGRVVKDQLKGLSKRIFLSSCESSLKDLEKNLAADAETRSKAPEGQGIQGMVDKMEGISAQAKTPFLKKIIKAAVLPALITAKLFQSLDHKLHEHDTPAAKCKANRGDSELKKRGEPFEAESNDSRYGSIKKDRLRNFVSAAAAFVHPELRLRR